MDRRNFLQTATVGAAALGAPASTLIRKTPTSMSTKRRPRTWRCGSRRSSRCSSRKDSWIPAALDAIIETVETKVGPHHGARVVARAWVDPDYKRRLLANAPAAIAELGYTSGEPEHMVALENTDRVHNLVVCTLCSCYPWTMLGLPPVWYKSNAYRSRAVIDPRGVLREFGTELGDDVEVRVWDSTAEVRYLVIPERPPGTEQMTEQELAALVTRDAIVGVAKPALPAPGASA